mmetsp:Transcript_18945/g.40813  ORF Transcript_18945/g.40813 Transcript_18945/m.40813 type:complete len:203 (+) Transcript_18945:350-958(+)
MLLLLPSLHHLLPVGQEAAAAAAAARHVQQAHGLLGLPPIQEHWQLLAPLFAGLLLAVPRWLFFDLHHCLAPVHDLALAHNLHLLHLHLLTGLCRPLRAVCSPGTHATPLGHLPVGPPTLQQANLHPIYQRQQELPPLLLLLLVMALPGHATGTSDAPQHCAAPLMHQLLLVRQALGHLLSARPPSSVSRFHLRQVLDWRWH